MQQQLPGAAKAKVATVAALAVCTLHRLGSVMISKVCVSLRKACSKRAKRSELTNELIRYRIYQR